LNNLWQIYTARRFFHSSRKGSDRSSSLLSLAGLTVGTLTLIVVMGVMNGFQLNYIENILEVSSYHIRISSSDADFQIDLSDWQQVAAVVPMAETQTMIIGSKARTSGALLRSVPSDWMERDISLNEYLHVNSGSLPGLDAGSIFLGHSLSRILGVGPGDTVSVLSLTGGTTSVRPVRRNFMVRGIISCGYSEIDSTLALVSPDSGLFRQEEYFTAVKLKDRNRDLDFLGALKNDPAYANLEARSWREYNRVFFGALKMEKNIMMLLVGLIFIVVGVNIFHWMKRLVSEKKEDMAVLRALGASPMDIQGLFMLQGFMTGLLSALAGAVSGIIICHNLSLVIQGIEWILVLFIRLLSPFFILFGTSADIIVRNLSVGTFYYLYSIPVELITSEVIYISLFALFTPVGASLFASFRLLSLKPAEVLRDE